MKNTVFVLLMGVLHVACTYRKPAAQSGATLFTDRHMRNVTQLTFEGDNGEAYFSWDGKKLIFQSSREGYS